MNHRNLCCLKSFLDTRDLFMLVTSISHHVFPDSELRVLTNACRPPGTPAAASAPAQCPQIFRDDQPDRLSDELSDNPSDWAHRDSPSDSLQPEGVGTLQ